MRGPESAPDAAAIPTVLDSPLICPHGPSPSKALIDMPLLRKHNPMRNLQGAAEIVRTSEFFDPDWYVTQNAGGLKVVGDAALHLFAMAVVTAPSRVALFRSTIP